MLEADKDLNKVCNNNKCLTIQNAKKSDKLMASLKKMIECSHYNTIVNTLLVSGKFVKTYTQCYDCQKILSK